MTVPRLMIVLALVLLFVDNCLAAKVIFWTEKVTFQLDGNTLHKYYGGGVHRSGVYSGTAGYMAPGGTYYTWAQIDRLPPVASKGDIFTFDVISSVCIFGYANRKFEKPCGIFREIEFEVDV